MEAVVEIQIDFIRKRSAWKHAVCTDLQIVRKGKKIWTKKRRKSLRKILTTGTNGTANGTGWIYDHINTKGIQDPTCRIDIGFKLTFDSLCKRIISVWKKELPVELVVMRFLLAVSTAFSILLTTAIYIYIYIPLDVCLLPIWATAIKSNRLKQFESYPDYATYIFLQTPWVIYQQFYVDSVAILTIFDMQFAIFHLLQPYFGCGIWHFPAGCNKFWQRMQMRLMMRWTRHCRCLAQIPRENSQLSEEVNFLVSSSNLCSAG